MNRGVAKRPLFEDRQDQRFFLARVVRQIRLGRLEVHAFCLMTTHFHMLVRSPVGRLSEAMRRIQNEHSRRFNRRRRRDGTLIRGRFFSKPVKSLTYRRTLVGYIDANPVKAGIVATGPEYALGSARAYMQPSGPRWLSRHWVEGEACALTKCERFTPEAYLSAFGDESAPGAAELIRARIASTAIEDPLDDLIGAAPEHVRQWMQRKARLADGCRIGIPVCGPASLARALSEDIRKRGIWRVEDGRSTRRGEDLASAGMLRDLCGLTWHGIASTARETESRVRNRATQHRRMLENDPAYAERAARVAKAAMERCVRQR